MLGYLGTQITLQQTKLHAETNIFRFGNPFKHGGCSWIFILLAILASKCLWIWAIYFSVVFLGMAFFKHQYVLIVITWNWVVKYIHPQFYGVSNRQADPIGIGKNA